MPSTTAIVLINSLEVGGAERAVQAAVAELRRRHRQVHLVCLEPPTAAPALPFRALSRMRGSAGGFVKLAALPVLALRLSRFVSAVDADVVMSHLFRANFVNVLARQWGGSRHRVILVNHTRLSRLRTEGLQGRINWALSRWLYPRADVVASVSTGAAAESARLLGLGERAVVLHDPIEAATAGTEASATPEQPGILVCMGRMVALKRFQDAICAFARLAARRPGLRLRLVGDGPQRTALEQLAARLAVADRVDFLGTVDNPGGLLAGSAAFISSSETEGFGMAIVEALAAGVPVVASDCAFGPREILSPGSDPSRLLEAEADFEVAEFGLLYPVGSVDALERALWRILCDDRLRAGLSRGGPSRAADFSVTRAGNEYERLLFRAEAP